MLSGSSGSRDAGASREPGIDGNKRGNAPSGGYRSPMSFSRSCLQNTIRPSPAETSSVYNVPIDGFPSGGHRGRYIIRTSEAVGGLFVSRGRNIGGRGSHGNGHGLIHLLECDMFYRSGVCHSCYRVRCSLALLYLHFVH